METTTNLETFLNENHIPGMGLTYRVKNTQNDTGVFIRAYHASKSQSVRWLLRDSLQPYRFSQITVMTC